MPTLPEMGALLVRTDFTDDDAWDQVRNGATQAYGPHGFCASVEPVSDPQWVDATWGAVKAAAPVGVRGSCVLFIADSITFASAEHPILVVDLSDKFLSVAEFPEIASRTPFRCIPSALWDVQNNLSIANVSWEDYVSQIGGGGVYRGDELPASTPDELAAAYRQMRLNSRTQRLDRTWLSELAEHRRATGSARPQIGPGHDPRR